MVSHNMIIMPSAIIQFKLSSFRIVIIIFYQTAFVWDIFGFVLPAMPAVKLGLGCWIMLPQLKGEFYLYHLLLEYILQAERKLLSYRCDICSSLVGLLT